MKNVKFVVRWTDADGKNHSKSYDDEPAAKKAKQWLLDNGATSVDVAVSMGGREYKANGGAIPEGAKPGIEQPTFL